MEAKVGQAVAVDEHGIRRNVKAEDGAAHRQQRGIENVQRVDLGAIGPGYRPCHGVPPHLDGKPVAVGRGEPLRVAEPLGVPGRVEDHRRRNDRPRERPAACLVDAGNEAAR